jgi:hypothetical protein
VADLEDFGTGEPLLIEVFIVEYECLRPALVNILGTYATLVI